MKKYLLLVMVFSLIYATVQNAYSYDDYFGRVKYGTYHCEKNGETCDFARYENSSTSHGGACPKYIAIGKQKDIIHKAKMADFLNSQYCKYTSTNVKKYRCQYDDGNATIFVEDGKVKSASHSTSVHRELQQFYEPDKCVEQPLKEIQEAHAEDTSTIPDYQIDFIETLVDMSVRQQSQSFTDACAEKITSMENEIKDLKQEIRSQKVSLYYIAGSLLIIFIIALIAVIKSNNNPYGRL